MTRFPRRPKWDAESLNPAPVVMSQSQEVTIGDGSNKTAVLLSLGQAVTAGEPLAAKGVPGSTHTVVTNNMFRQTFSVGLEIHIRLLQLHGKTIGIPPLTILTTTLSQAHSEAMEIHLRVFNRHNATAPASQLEDLKYMVLDYRNTLLHGTKASPLIG